MLKTIGTAARRLFSDSGLPSETRHERMDAMTAAIHAACRAETPRISGFASRSRGVDANPVSVHPGELLREIVFPTLQLSIAEAAAAMGIVRQTLHRVTSERAGVSAEMALRLGKLTGTKPIVWLRLQAAYDLAAAERRIGWMMASIGKHAR